MLLKREDIQTIFDESYTSLCRFAGSIVGHNGQAQEIAQESFLRLCQSELGGIPIGEVRFWLFRVARNLAINEFNKGKTRMRLWEKAVGAFSKRKPSPEEILIRSENQIAIRKMLDELPEHQRSALVLREQEEMSYGDIALVLNISNSKVKTDIYRGRQGLRNLWYERNRES